ncbi:MAG: hypothetical protein J6B77_06290 [Clostridia bacterium]|nr:hypothetical protein [Clostridia bacterium]
MRSLIFSEGTKDGSGAVHTARSPRRVRTYPSYLTDLLPIRIAEAIRIEVRERTFGTLEEIRLRRETVSSLSTDCGTVLLPVVLSGREMDETLTRISGGSLYAHSETIGEGYLILPEGVRVGICGRAAIEHGRVIGVSDVSALSFRIPGDVRDSGNVVEKLLLAGRENGRGVLIYAPPGEGKTTLLRSIVRRISGDGRVLLRTAVVDTRGELSLSTLFPQGARSDCRYTVDLLSGYPRPKGIEIAVRTMNAEVVVCDEIGGVEEAQAVLAVQNCGVPLLATAHGRSLSGLLRRPGLRMLHEGRIFSHYVGIRRSDGGFAFDTATWEEANAVC